MVQGLGSRAIIVSANRGLGLELARHVLSLGMEIAATCRSASEEMKQLSGNVHIIENIDLAKENTPDLLCKQIKSLEWPQCDTLIVVTGLFTEDTLDNLQPENHRKMYEVCALGPLRLVCALVLAGVLKKDGKIGFITSEGGSVSLRSEKEGGANYGHHMSKCAENMMTRLLALDLKPKGISVVAVHPGFMKTSMTEHYEEDYEALDAVQPAEVVGPIVETVQRLTVENTGRFIAPLGSKSLGYGVYAMENPEKYGPFAELPW